MQEEIHIKPLPRRKRQQTFFLLFFVFVTVIPILYLTASGYRLDFTKPTSLVSTGGISVTINEPDAGFYIDDAEVRTVRTFRKSFYAQGIDVGTHRLHVQKEGYHTWVKELPVSKRLVTEALVFNLPLVPQTRIITPFVTATGTPVVTHDILFASTTNTYLSTTTKNTKAFVPNDEFSFRSKLFATTSTSTLPTGVLDRVNEFFKQSTTTTATSTATTTEAMIQTATSTIISGNVRLYEEGDDVYAEWIGPHGDMPYYYCAPDFPRYATSSPEVLDEDIVVEKEMVQTVDDMAAALPREEEKDDELLYVVHPVQTVSEDDVCEPKIRIDRKWSRVIDFDFFPGSTDFVILVLENGIFVVEIDDRSWQNVQPLIMGNNLTLSIDNDEIYVYDGVIIYHVLAELE